MSGLAFDCCGCGQPVYWEPGRRRASLRNLDDYRGRHHCPATALRPIEGVMSCLGCGAELALVAGDRLNFGLETPHVCPPTPPARISPRSTPAPARVAALEKLPAPRLRGLVAL